MKKNFDYKGHEVVIVTRLDGDAWTWRYTIDDLQSFAAANVGHWTEAGALMEAAADAKKHIDEMSDGSGGKGDSGHAA
ncbi:hypothetical protein QTH90_28985 [Variovorax sp. J2P1-59]|uniref:hypothetical protein n=1 Tax=Variovorax flavidus TaxID=3053501 RepID=UPI0025786B3D|nr:hypothetical protein [Variovorax sp. J2P1-59]MDM0078474.1 hypothetical protein [Variovorax sp. J2P1-59]